MNNMEIKNKNNKTTIILLHLIVWLMMFAAPYLLSYDRPQFLGKVLFTSWTFVFFSALLFYLNYFVIIEKTLFKKKTMTFFIINALIIIVLTYLTFEVKAYLFEEIIHKVPRHKGPPRKLFVYIDGLSFILPLVFSVALKVSERWKKSELERKEVEKSKLEAELKYLKYQVQPHFFFNSLNNIYSLIDISPETAKEVVHSLAKLMRYQLYETNTEKVSLVKEISFMKTYIELMKLRFTEKVEVTYNFEEVANTIEVSPLLFIVLMENAFKHGISATENSHIHFELLTTKDEICFKSSNPNFPKGTSDKSGSGIGLENLKKRLELIYNDSFNMGITVEEDFVAKLSLPIENKTS